MMPRIRFIRLLSISLLLAHLAAATTTGDQPDATASVKDVDLGTVKPLLDTNDAETTTELPTKPTPESKKKATIDFSKSKLSKFKDKAQDEETTTLSMEKTTKLVEVPLLSRGEPIVVSTGLPEVTTDLAGRARALNVTATEPGNTLHTNNTDLSDVSMDDEDKEVEGGEYIARDHNGTSTTTMVVKPLPTVAPGCTDGNKTYGIGETIERGCEERCICEAEGKIAKCEPVCREPLVRAGKKLFDPFCHARSIPDNPCCDILVCTDSATEPEESCVFGNTTIPRGQTVQDGCEKTCICEAGGHLKCQPRCPPNDTASGIKQHDRCVVLQDPRDPSCCTITLCDVTLGDHEIKPENVGDLSVNLTDVKVLNSTAIKLKLSPGSSEDVVIEISENNHVWTMVKPSKDGIISNLQPAHSYYVRVVEGSRAGPAIHVSLLAEVIKTGVSDKMEKGACSHRGKTYKIGAEWYDDCIAVCFCNETAQTECVTIECPTDFGLDVLDPHCLDWETVPPNHVAKAPNCCPQEVRCRNNGSCTYGGNFYDNWSRIPTNITGCEKECFCEFGNVTCSDVCPPVPPKPPAKLNCGDAQPTLAHLPDDTCCLHWTCAQKETTTTTTAKPGTNSTTFVYPGPVPIDSGSKKLKEKPDKPSSTYPWPVLPSGTQPPQPAVPPNSDVVHYPMDPGHPTAPYVGPYNPEYKPTQPSVEDVFHLGSHEKVPSTKDKNKSKSDSKKPVDAFKPHKESSDQFPGPLAPDRFPEKPHPPEKPIYPSQIPLSPNVPQNPNKLPGPNKGGVPSDHAEQPQFIPLNPNDHIPGHNFDFTPTNGENIPATHFDTILENPAAGPPYGARPEPADPNNVVPSSPKKKIPGSDIYPGEKGKPNSKRPDIPQRIPHPETIPDELYHLINLQHPGLINLNNGPPNGHPGLYDLQPEIANGAGGEKVQQPQVPPNYFGPGGLPPKKGGAHGKPQIYSQKDENGQTTYHVHASEVPHTPQQLEDLIAHIAQHDPSGGNNPLYQGHYPVGQPTQQLGVNQGAAPPPPLPPHLGPHGFVPQPPPGQSDYDRLPIGQYPGILGQSAPNRPVVPVFDIVVTDLRAISNHSVHLVFTVPHFLIGLQGRVEVRYTSDKSNPDPLTWKTQTFAPPTDLIDTDSLEFELAGLEPATLYRLMIVVRIHDLSNTHASKIYEVLTITPVETGLRVSIVNATTAEVEWQFSNHELQFIDATYLMYKAKDEKTYLETPLLHRSINHYLLEHLSPNTEYEVILNAKDIIGQTGILILNNNSKNFTTTSDIYSFDVRVEIKTTKSSEVEITWSGIPQPEEKYYNLIRAVYQTDSGKEGIVFFKKDKKETKKIINDLKPGTRYRLWLEVYQTNGQLKKSNVQDFVTKPGALPQPGASQQQGKLASSIPLHEGDYYGALVIVGILALMAILSTMILLMMLLKRRTSSKADISPRKTTSAYDNPSYKTCEEAVPNGRNGTSEHEMTTLNGHNNSHA